MTKLHSAPLLHHDRLQKVSQLKTIATVPQIPMPEGSRVREVLKPIMDKALAKSILGLTIFRLPATGAFSLGLPFSPWAFGSASTSALILLHNAYSMTGNTTLMKEGLLVFLSLSFALVHNNCPSALLLFFLIIVNLLRTPSSLVVLLSMRH